MDINVSAQNCGKNHQKFGVNGSRYREKHTTEREGEEGGEGWRVQCCVGRMKLEKKNPLDSCLLVNLRQHLLDGTWRFRVIQMNGGEPEGVQESVCG